LSANQDRKEKRGVKGRGRERAQPLSYLPSFSPLPLSLFLDRTAQFRPAMQRFDNAACPVTKKVFLPDSSSCFVS